MSKETFYFSHDYNARNDIKIQALLVEHGAVGYGVYWIIVEILHEESQKKLQLNNLTYVAVARQSSTSVEQVKSIVECCLECELFEEDDGCFFSKRILKNIDKRMDISEKRAKAGRISAEKRKKATGVEQNSTNVNKEKKRKEKKRKGKKRIILIQISRVCLILESLCLPMDSKKSWWTSGWPFEKRKNQLTVNSHITHLFLR